MPEDRDRDRDEERDDPDDEDADREDEADPAAEDDRDEDDEDDEDDEEAEREARAREARARKRAAERKRQRERPAASGRAADRSDRPARKSAGPADEPRRGAGEKKRGAEDRKPRAEGRDKPGERRRPARAASEERRPVPRGRKGAVARRRGEPEPGSIEIREPADPPEPDVDLAGPIEPAWEQGLVIGGGLVIVSVLLALGTVVTSAAGAGRILQMLGLGLILLASALAGFGLLARKSWGYVVGLGASALGVVVSLLWALGVVVDPPVPALRILMPLGWLVANAGAVVVLFWMRWGPGPMAAEHERLRSIKLRTLAYTTMHGELAYAGAVAALLGSLLALSMLLGSTQAQPARSATARFADGMELERFEQPPDNGTVVLARWGAEVYFFLGRVDDRRNEDEVHVSYLDGDQEWVRLADIRRDTLRAGSMVHVHVQGSEGWLPAQVTQRTGDRVEVDLGSRRVWVPLAMVRVREL